MSENLQDMAEATQDEVKVSDQVEVQVSIAIGPARYSKVKVTAESGIFKGGVQYNQGDEAVIKANAAKRFEANGDVEILGAAEAPTQGGE